jgi:hypothetical protein
MLPSGVRRFKHRRDAEQALAEIIEDGGKHSDFRIDTHPDGGFMIAILENNNDTVAGFVIA